MMLNMKRHKGEIEMEYINIDNIETNNTDNDIDNIETNNNNNNIILQLEND